MSTPSTPPSNPGPAGPQRRLPAAARAGMPLVVLGALAAGAVGGGLWVRGGDEATPGAGGPGGTGPAQRLGAVRSVAFSGFDGCDALLRYYRDNAARVAFDDVYAMAEAGALVRSGAGAPAAAAPGATSSGGTNVQVAGVDEADVAKRSGDLLLTVSQNGERSGLTVLRVASSGARVVGRFDTRDWMPGSLLVEGDTVLLIGDIAFTPTAGAAPDTSTSSEEPAARSIVPGPRWQPRTRIVQLDVSDPARPRQVRTLDVDGAAVGVRLVDGVARVTTSSPPRVRPSARLPRTTAGTPGATDPSATPSLPATTVDDWLPRYTLTEAGAAPTGGRLLDCDEVAAPTAFSGLDTLSLLSFDLRSPAGIGRWEKAGVVAAGTTVYATAGRTYVATPAWQPPLRGPGLSRIAPARRAASTTAIHAFGTEGTSMRYLGSGSVAGTLLNQFAMDEHDGRVRVASTVAPPVGMPELRTPQAPDVDPAAPTATPVPAVPSVRPTPNDDQRQQSYVTVLELRDGGLVQVGRVGGLGRDETIRSVRFAGPVGYVVTFRQTDPLYSLDLSDPTRPRVTGELKIPGYSAYLHPIGDGLILGVGQDADLQGRTKGLQMSLFDVTDPAAPRRLDQVALPGGWSDVEGDHHAFTYADGLALVPYAGHSTVRGRDVFDAGVVAVRVEGRRLGGVDVLRPTAERPGAVNGDGARLPVPLRTFVTADAVLTVTDRGVAVHDLPGYAPRAFVAF